MTEHHDTEPDRAGSGVTEHQAGRLPGARQDGPGARAPARGFLPGTARSHTGTPERNGQAQRLSLKRWYETVTISKQLDSDRRAAYVPQLAHIESRPVTVFPAHSSDRWGKEASLAQLGAGFIQPFAGGTAMAGRAAKGSPLRGPGADAGHYPAGIAAGGRSPLRDGPADRPGCEVQDQGGGCQRLEQADRIARNEILISPTKLHRKR